MTETAQNGTFKRRIIGWKRSGERTVFLAGFRKTMSKYRMEDGKVLDTDKASAEWEEAIDWNGRNFVSRPTGSQWEHETLYRSSKGRYYVERKSLRQGSSP